MKKRITFIIIAATVGLLTFFATSHIVFHRATIDIIRCFPHIAIGTSFALLLLSIVSISNNLKMRLEINAIV